MVTGACPVIDLEWERKVQQALLGAIRNGWIQSAHDISDGGLAIALAESCIMNRQNPLGVVIDIKPGEMRPEWLLFSESQSRILISTKPENRDNIEKYFSAKNIPLIQLGKVGGKNLVINDRIEFPLSELFDIYYTTLEKLME